MFPSLPKFTPRPVFEGRSPRPRPPSPETISEILLHGSAWLVEDLLVSWHQEHPRRSILTPELIESILAARLHAHVVREDFLVLLLLYRYDEVAFTLRFREFFRERLSQLRSPQVGAKVIRFLSLGYGGNADEPDGQSPEPLETTVIGALEIFGNVHDAVGALAVRAIARCDSLALRAIFEWARAEKREINRDVLWWTAPLCVIHPGAKTECALELARLIGEELDCSRGGADRRSVEALWVVALSHPLADEEVLDHAFTIGKTVPKFIHRLHFCDFVAGLVDPSPLVMVLGSVEQ